MKKIAIIMGSDSDLPVLEGAIKTLNQFDVPCEVRVLSAHRTPIEAADFARSAREKGFGAIIAAAGKAITVSDDGLVVISSAAVEDKDVLTTLYRALM